MRLPNGYGSIIKLKGLRRKPYAVRISYYEIKKEENNNIETKTQRFKYLGYFKTNKEAMTYLANYNLGIVIKEVPLTKQPTFSDMYEGWYKHKHEMNKKPSASTSRSYAYAFSLLEDLHHRKMVSLRLEDLQKVSNKYKELSKGVSQNVKKVLYGVFEYAIKHEVIEKDYSKLVDYEYSSEKRVEHTDFKPEEIKKLWDNKEIPFVDWVLIMIYTGWRVSEFCELRNENINIEERYMIGGKKTLAGLNRTVPIHEKIIPLIQNLYNSDNEFLICSKLGRGMYYKTFLLYWDETMKAVGMNHMPHDTRYTTATLLDNAGANKVCIKKIMGHTTSDITDGVYIQKDLSELIRAIDLIIV